MERDQSTCGGVAPLPVLAVLQQSSSTTTNLSPPCLGIKIRITQAVVAGRLETTPELRMLHLVIRGRRS